MFPGVTQPKPDYAVLEDALVTNLAKNQLQNVPWFIEKIIQVRQSLDLEVYTNLELPCHFSRGYNLKKHIKPPYELISMSLNNLVQITIILIYT